MSSQLSSLMGRVRALTVGVASLAMGFMVVGPASAGPGGPVALPVDCSAGDTITGALLTASTMFEPVIITVNGVCKERVVIARDDVIIEAGPKGATLDGAGLSGYEALVTVAAAHRVALHSLTLLPDGIPGLDLDPGAVVQASALEIAEASMGIILRDGSQLTLSASSILESKETGISNAGGALDITSTTVAKGSSAGVSVDGGSLRMSSSHVDDNDSWGVSVTSAANATITSSSMDRNAVGLFVRLGGSVLTGTATTLNENKGEGVRVWDGSSVLLGIGTTVAANGRSGVEVEGGSIVAPQKMIIKANGHHGIEVRDTSLVKSTSGQYPKIYSNNGWGVVCEGAPGDARLSTPGFPATAVFGNTAGQLNCPGYFLP